MVDPRSPVVVGVGQVSRRVAVEDAKPPIELFEDAARAADADAGGSLLAQTDIVGVAQIVSWMYPDAGAMLARRLGISPRATAVSTIGGNSPLLLANDFAPRIQRNECDVVLIGGAESMHTRWRARREPRVELTWDRGDDPPCDWVIGDNRAPSTDYEMTHGAAAPTLVYPLFETALRADAGRTVAEHQQHTAALWSEFARVAADNPHAWSRAPFSASDIATVSAENRMIVFPYPKRMCANIDVDQGAAFIMCAYETARAAKIADDRMVFLHSAASAHDHWFIGERWSLTESPAIAEAYHDAIELLERTRDVGPDDLRYFDLYSCFPSAVQIAQRALGLVDDDRPLTVTGGLGFAGGPANNYPSHAIARMVETLRADPGAVGCTTALGWYVTKHAVALWSTRPPDDGFALAIDTQSRVDVQPRRALAGLFDGDATIEATSVPLERDGTPSGATCTLLTDDGRRLFARAPALASAFTEAAWEGRRVAVRSDGSTNTVDG
ncbi:MAG: acetyl-CoA acetyltransferase [Actinomycetota bacterium]